MTPHESEVIHLVVTGKKDGRVVHKERVKLSKYSGSSEYYRAVRTKQGRLAKEYPDSNYRVNIFLSNSDSPIALESVSS